jgi:hypothetical protein
MPAPAQGNRDNRIQDIQLQTTDATQTVVVDRLIRPATAILIQTWVAARQAGDTGRAGRSCIELGPGVECRARSTLS